MALFGKHILQHYSDESLIFHYRNEENPKYIGILFERHTELVFLLCMKYLKDEADSEDAVMQIFEKLIHDLKKYEIERFKSWLSTVVRNHCLASINKKRLAYEKELESRQGTIQYEEIHFVKSEKEEEELRINRLEQAIQQLNPSQKKCIHLFYLEQKSYREISNQTGYTYKQVKSHIQNGKRKLKNLLS